MRKKAVKMKQRLTKNPTMDVLIRTYYDAQSNTNDRDRDEILNIVKEKINKISRRKRKRELRDAAMREQKNAKNTVYKLFLEYIAIFGDL